MLQNKGTKEAKKKQPSCIRGSSKSSLNRSWTASLSHTFLNHYAVWDGDPTVISVTQGHDMDMHK